MVYIFRLTRSVGIGGALTQRVVLGVPESERTSFVYNGRGKLAERRRPTVRGHSWQRFHHFQIQSLYLT